MKKGLFIVFLFLLTEIHAESPQHFSFSIQGGPYVPKIQGYSTIYGGSNKPMFEFAMEWQFLKLFGKLALGTSIGYMRDAGYGLFEQDNVQSEVRFVFQVVPAKATLFYRADLFKNQPVVPFGEFGYDFYYFTEDSATGGHSFSGGKDGYHYGGGLQILLDILDKESAGAMDADYGINNTFLTFEYRISKVNDFGKGVWDFSSKTWFAGLMFEF